MKPLIEMQNSAPFPNKIMQSLNQLIIVQTFLDAVVVKG
jgi:hypothetical protein